MIAEFIENFVHFERRENGLDQHRSPDAALRKSQTILGIDKNVVPQPGFEMAFEFWKIEIRAASGGQELSRVVKKVQAKVEQ